MFFSAMGVQVGVRRHDAIVVRPDIAVTDRHSVCMKSILSHREVSISVSTIIYIHIYAL